MEWRGTTGFFVLLGRSHRRCCCSSEKSDHLWGGPGLLRGTPWVSLGETPLPATLAGKKVASVLSKRDLI